VIEDDVWFDRDFAPILDHASREMKDADSADPAFDVLYVSYAEARYGAPKELLWTRPSSHHVLGRHTGTKNQL
jgi:hypothetical protein